MTDTERLDVALVHRRLIETRTRAGQLIEAGHVQVNRKIALKPGQKVSAADAITLLQTLKYVGRGGYKLEAALERFGVAVTGLTALDVGASTGGFTDCLLQRGAARVYAVDVGRNQLAAGLRADARVTALEQTDIRQAAALPEAVDLVVIDVSFISLRLVLPAVTRFLKPDSAGIIALIKPQFEAGADKIGKGGVVKNPAVRQKVVAELMRWIETQGWQVAGLIQSPVTGGDGNVEYLAHLNPHRSPEKPFALPADK